MHCKNAKFEDLFNIVVFLILWFYRIRHAWLKKKRINLFKICLNLYKVRRKKSFDSFGQIVPSCIADFNSRKVVLRTETCFVIIELYQKNNNITELDFFVIPVGEKWRPCLRRISWKYFRQL